MTNWEWYMDLEWLIGQEGAAGRPFGEFVVFVVSFAVFYYLYKGWYINLLSYQLTESRYAQKRYLIKVIIYLSILMMHVGLYVFMDFFRTCCWLFFSSQVLASFVVVEVDGWSSAVYNDIEKKYIELEKKKEQKKARDTENGIGESSEQKKKLGVSFVYWFYFILYMISPVLPAVSIISRIIT